LILTRFLWFSSVPTNFSHFHSSAVEVLGLLGCGTVLLGYSFGVRLVFLDSFTADDAAGTIFLCKSITTHPAI